MNIGGGNSSLQFDSISLHGIWSWISSENRAHIVEFAKKYLKPGGMFYNSYNCFPGWAPNAPMRELMILHDKYGESSKNNTFDRVENAFNFVEKLIELNPNYAQRVPGLKEFIESTKKLDHNYLAHEYFNSIWDCMYFTDVAEILSTAKLEFACTATPSDAIDAMNLKQEAIDFLKSIENPIVKEQVRDYFVNQQFRKDIYVRGARRLSQAERMIKILNTNFVLLNVDEPQMKCNTALGEVSFTNPNLEAIMEYLRSDNYRPKKFADLVKNHPEIIFANLEQAIVVLMTMGHLVPCQDKTIIDKVKKNCDNLNNYLCSRSEISTDIAFLVSPVIGGGFSIGRFEQVFVELYKRGKRDIDSLAKESWTILEAQGQRLIKEGKTLNSAEENLAEFKSLAQMFLDKRLIILKALQII